MNVAQSQELQALPAMCYHCFDVLIDALQKQKSNSPNGKRSKINADVPEFSYQLADASVECPLFVTWEKKKRDDSYHLRGCIGTLSPKLLVTSVGDYALISAFKDRRFNPISLSELSSLRVAVSLLVKYEECKDVFDWTVGIHGILIKFIIRGVEYSATYLPEVAKEQRWDQQKTVASLVQKAGYHGTLTDDLLKTIECTRYQSSKCRVTFEEYMLENCEGNDPTPKPRHWNSCNNL